MVHCTELVTNGKETQTVGERSTVVQRGRHEIITILHAGCSMIVRKVGLDVRHRSAEQNEIVLRRFPVQLRNKDINATERL